MAVEICVEREHLQSVQQMFDQSSLEGLHEQLWLRVVEEVIEHLRQQEHALRTHKTLHIIHVLHTRLALSRSLQKAIEVFDVRHERLSHGLRGLLVGECAHHQSIAVIHAFGQQCAVFASQTVLL